MVLSGALTWMCGGGDRRVYRSPEVEVLPPHPYRGVLPPSRPYYRPLRKGLRGKEETGPHVKLAAGVRLWYIQASPERWEAGRLSVCGYAMLRLGLWDKGRSECMDDPITSG